MENRTIKIVLAEDQLLFRKGMSAMISAQPGMEILAEASDGQELLDFLRSSSTLPDLLLLDLRMPDMNGIEVTRIIKAEFPDINILILSAHNEDRYIAHMVELGVHGYLDKNSEPDEVVKAIQSIIKSGFYFNHASIQAMRSGLIGGRQKISLEDPAGLTAREREVLELICKEYTAPEIADKLFISVRTVDGHRTNLLLKTGARNIAGLVMFAVRNGIVTD